MINEETTAMKKLLRVLNPSETDESSKDAAKASIRSYIGIKHWKKESFKNELMQVDVLFAPKEASQDSLRTAVEAVKKPDSTFHKPFLLFDLCKVVLGDAQDVSTRLDAFTTSFCLDVPLRVNTQNTLIATAIDNLAAPPRPAASAVPVQVVHVDPSSIVIAEASSRPLTIEETELLVENGVINLDNPSNFNVSMFTIVITIGQFPVTYSQPVAVPTTPSVSYGSPGGGGGWTTGGGGIPSGTPRPVTGCVTGCSKTLFRSVLADQLSDYRA